MPTAKRTHTTPKRKAAPPDGAAAYTAASLARDGLYDFKCAAALLAILSDGQQEGELTQVLKLARDYIENARRSQDEVMQVVQSHLRGYAYPSEVGAAAPTAKCTHSTKPNSKHSDGAKAFGAISRGGL